MSDYQFGTSVKVSATFRDEDGVLFDPTTVRLIVQAPDRTELRYLYGTDAALVKDSTGHYHSWVTPTQTGRYAYRFQGEGNVASVAGESAFVIGRSVFTEAALG